MLKCSTLLPRSRVACYSKMSMIPEPPPRKFVPIEQSEVTSIREPAGFKFRLVSYNVLAQAYVKSAFFPHSPAPCLNAELVIKEEIDYNDLVDAGGDGKTSIVDKEHKLLAGGIEDESKTGSESKETRDNDRGDPNDPQVRLKRDCVGIMAAFRLNNPSCHHVIIANTHLYWDPEWSDVKIAQAKYLLSRVAGFQKLVSNKFDCTPSIIVAGDFNSVPGDEVYQHLVSSTNLVGPETADELPIPLSSVYAVTRGEPEFTNCTPGFTGTLDYILFSVPGELKPVSFLELPGRESMDLNGGLPNYHHPSDHLPIGAEFEL